MLISQFTFTTSADIVRDFVQCVTVRWYDWTEIHLNVLSLTNFFDFIREHCIVPTFQNIMFHCFCWVARVTTPVTVPSYFVQIIVEAAFPESYSGLDDFSVSIRIGQFDFSGGQRFDSSVFQSLRRVVPLFLP